MNSVLKRLAKLFSIRQIKTTAYHPQTNGSLERSHHSLKEYIKTAVSSDVEWPEVLELATFSYNSSVHEAHQFTPYELVFGKTARLPSEKI